MSTEKKLIVAALCNGTVIDHIPSEKLFKVVSLLNLNTYENLITIGNNLESKKIPTKGIIKISDRFLAEEEANKIALIAPNGNISIIKNYVVVEKRPLILPSEIKEIVQCTNSNCVTNHQFVPTRFQVLSNENSSVLKCHYCEREVKQDEVRIK
jgi:aspartate carbamoyltransferase regulatory subunit